jgi:hypothetical protein
VTLSASTTNHSNQGERYDRRKTKASNEIRTKEIKKREKEEMEMSNKKQQRCTLPENDRNYYYIRIDTDKRTGKKKEQKVYPNLFNDLVSIPTKKERK